MEVSSQLHAPVAFSMASKPVFSEKGAVSALVPSWTFVESIKTSFPCRDGLFYNASISDYIAEVAS
jgi:hypothetical protein